MSSPAPAPTTATTASIKHTKHPPPPLLPKKFVSSRTLHPAAYRVVAFHPPLDSTSHSPLPQHTVARLPLDCPRILDLTLTQPAQPTHQLQQQQQHQIDPSDQHGTDYENVRVKVDPISSTCLGVTIEARDRRAWRVPEHVVPRRRDGGPRGVYQDEAEDTAGEDRGKVKDKDNDKDEEADHSLEFLWAEDGFVVQHKETGESIFDTTGLGMVLRDQFLEISTRLGGGRDQGGGRGRGRGRGNGGGKESPAYVYGLGENVGRFRRPAESVSTMWARDCPCKPDHNLYGCHPFYVEALPESGTVHGVLLMSSNGMDVSLSEDREEEEEGKGGGHDHGHGSIMTYKVIGGLLEFYFFSGPTLQDVIRQYTALVGRPALVPYWAMGNHQCRWGYETLERVQEVVSKFHSSKIPLEAMWIDIDYMDAYKCFTFDKARFPVKDLAAFSQQLHAQDQHLVMILDPGIKLQYEPGLYPPYDDGVAKNLFIKRRLVQDDDLGNKHDSHPLVDFVGKVWPGLTVFPDWFHPTAQEYWTEHVTRWVREIGLDGIWIDMNEIASFHNGDASTFVRPEDDRPVRMSDFTIKPKKEKKDKEDSEMSEEDEDEQKTEDTVGDSDRTAGDSSVAIIQPQHQQQAGGSKTKAKTTVTAVEKTVDQVDVETEESDRPQDVIAEHDEAEEEKEKEKEREEEDTLEATGHPRSVVSMASIQAQVCGVGMADMCVDDKGDGRTARQSREDMDEEEQDTRPPVVYANVNHPPYKINNNNEQAALEFRTVSADAVHHGGVLEYDAHNLYGHMESMATYQALRTAYPDRKPFVLSRSTFVGSGQYACHWLGDNRSHWYDLRVSIAGLLNFQLFGIPMVGSDVGGFGDKASEELLIRWHQLGAFYPFMRNHNCMGLPSQEPYITPRVAKVTRHHLALRYRLLPHWYTLFQRAHYRGDPVCAPLWSLAPRDRVLLDVDEQFMVGRAILVSPVLHEHQTTVHATFPPGLWYGLESGLVEVAVAGPVSTTVELQAPLESMPVHVLGGSILPMCGLPKDVFLATTRQVLEAGLELVVVLDANGLARGEVLVDDDRMDVQQASRVVMEVATPGVLRVECRPLLAKDNGGKSEVKEAKAVEIQSIVIWGVGLDLTKFSSQGAARETVGGGGGGRVPPSLQTSPAQLDIKQVRLSRVEPVPEAELSFQHARELAAVDPRETHVVWDSRRAQLTVRIKASNPRGSGVGGGLLLRGGEGLELDWTEAVMA
ncbi:alpha-glucosidase maltase [Actinomortierella ambigua]|uniref:Alpha-glucosidase maltase n=1 Tax=Actinomortierella ambigua TaxID=1343610 RepID=A0A9P6PZL3_9FUNG|nr:alpha-glucosidase maltase [Actinomortierella ambigua]